MRPSRTVRAGQYLALCAYIVFLGFPLLWLLSTAFKSAPELSSLNPTLLPQHWTLDSFRTALEEDQLWSALRNSLVVAVATAVISTIIALPAAYAMARYRSRIRTIAVGWILVSQIFPFILIVIPLFLVLRDLSLLDTLQGLTLVYVVWSLPFTLWMLQGYASAIPVELEEAAAMDGAGKIRTLTQVVFPLLVPGVVATAMFAFISAWNEFFFALVVIQKPELQTIPLLLARYVGAEGRVNLGPLAATALIATLPSLIVFGIIQRKLISGMLSGAVKG
jgi:multiple sugar transport system permease protein